MHPTRTCAMVCTTHEHGTSVSLALVSERITWNSFAKWGTLYLAVKQKLTFEDCNHDEVGKTTRFFGLGHSE